MKKSKWIILGSILTLSIAAVVLRRSKEEPKFISMDVREPTEADAKDVLVAEIMIPKVLPPTTFEFPLPYDKAGEGITYMFPASFSVAEAIGHGVGGDVSVENWSTSEVNLKVFYYWKNIDGYKGKIEKRLTVARGKSSSIELDYGAILNVNYRKPHPVAAQQCDAADAPRR